MRGTLGTETSKYQEEEKSTEISQVVASESERGQTKSSNTVGVRTDISTSKHSQMGWEAQPETVIARSAKCIEGDRYPEYQRTRGIRWEHGGTTLQA